MITLDRLEQMDAETLDLIGAALLKIASPAASHRLR